jgi:RNA polymerase-binding transcription factor DksA
MALTSQQLKQLDALLTARELFLENDIEREVGNREDYTQMAGEAPDAGDESTASVIDDINRAEVSRDERELKFIADARLRMENGTYGQCSDCGMDIPFARLEVQPTAQRCARCQSLHEKTYAQDVRGSSL